MKGIVFTEFLDMVEEKFSIEVAEEIIEAAELPSGGVYTSVGTYDHGEILQLVGHLSRIASADPQTLVMTFGQHLFGRFFKGYPQLFEDVPSAFAFLGSIENHIHVEVKKLYPEAELPTFECSNGKPGHMEMMYRSARPFGDLAEGLILGCFDHFGENIELSREDLSAEAGSVIRFSMQKKMDA
jgi:hypothetical protein